MTDHQNVLSFCFDSIKSYEFTRIVFEIVHNCHEMC